MAEKSKSIAMGDRHNSNQVSLIFDGENKYLFKPRQASAEKALEAFLSDMEQEGFPFTPKCEHIISENADGFTAEFVPNSPAESDEDIRLYFKRCGALIFLAYLFGSNDLHYENIIACKDSPVLIDCETLMTGIADGENNKLKSLTSSVLKSHLLANWVVNEGKTSLVSGLLSDKEDAHCNLVFGGKTCYIYDYEAEVIDGFKSAYTFTLENKDKVKKALSHFEGSAFRFLLRPTEVYARLIALAKKLDDRKDLYITELLSEGYRRDKRENRLEEMQAVLDEEIRGVLCGDVPYFTIKYDDTGLYSDRLLKPDFLEHSPKSAVENRLNYLCADDCEAQKRIISQSLSSVRPLDKKTPYFNSGNDIYYSMLSLLEDGYVSSVSSGYIELSRGNDNNLYLQSAGFGLYEGLAGILLAYAALYKKTGDKIILESLMKKYQPLGEFINRSGKINASTNALSLQEGIIGVVSALIHIFELTEEKIFFDDASTLFGKLKLPCDDNIGFDFLSGISGLSCVLLKLDKALTTPWANVLADRLADCEPTLTGVAHGASGVALALAVLEKLQSTDIYDNKILSLLSFEENYFHADKNNWQDLRTDERIAFMHGWCSGAGGIAMARKSILSLTSNPEIRKICKRDISRAAENLSDDFIAKRDSLCCGNSARLMACSNINIKNSGLFGILCDKMRNNSLALFHADDTDDRNFGLMQGFAGVIYAVAMYNDEKSGGMLLC